MKCNHKDLVKDPLDIFLGSYRHCDRCGKTIVLNKYPKKKNGCFGRKK